MLEATTGKYICEPVGDFTETKSGIILARTTKEIPHRARVLSVGDAEVRKCTNCEENLSKVNPCKLPRVLCGKRNKAKKILAKPGDIVHFKMKGGIKIYWNEKDYVVLTYNDILAKEYS